jgi:hypothetical protein
MLHFSKLHISKLHISVTLHIISNACLTFVLSGYLSINRFGTIFASAHAGMTAEGDNSVLMQVGFYFMITYLSI